MKKIKTILKKFDIFGVNPNFHYKSKKKYRSAAGGMIFILIFILLLIYTYINLNSLLNLKKMSVISYENYLNQTEGINFNNYSLTFAFGFECENYFNYNKEEFENLFKFEIKFTNTTRKNNIIKREKKNINFHKCNFNDFYNEFNDSFFNLGLNNFYCPDNKNFSIKGDFTDLNFDYYEISLISNKNDFDVYYNLLSNDFCKFSLIFTDHIINIKNHKNPFIKNLNQIYIQLSPVDYIKKDVFFEVQEFNSIENLFFDYDKKTFSVKFLNEKEYVNYKGKERFNEKKENFDFFAKFFLRTERKIEIIERKYEKIYEFFENFFSLFVNLTIIFVFICSMLNNFFLYNSIIKKIFLYKLSEIKDEKHNIIKIIVNFFSNKNNNHQFKNNRFNTSDNLILNDFENSFQFLKLNKNKHISYNNNNNISNINNNNNNILNNNNSNNFSNYNNIINHTNIFLEHKNNNYKINENKFLNEKHRKLLKNNTAILYKLNNKSYLKLKNLIGLNYRKSILLNKKKKNKNSIIINDFETIVLIFFPCFASKKLKNKRLLDLNIKDKIYNSLDILSYLKNIKILENLSFVLLEKYENNLINFISKPSIFFANKYLTEYKFNKNHKIDENDLNSFFSSYKILNNVFNKNECQKKIVDLVDKEIEKIVN